jgi:hypothetical protein
LNKPHEQQLNLDTTFKYLNPILNPRKKKTNIKDSCSIKRDEMILKGKARGRGGRMSNKEGDKEEETIFNIL